MSMSAQLDEPACQLVFRHLQPIQVSGDETTIGLAGLYDIDKFESGPYVAAIVVLRPDESIFGEAFKDWEDAGLRWLEYDDAYTLQREEPGPDDIAFYYDDERKVYVLEPQGLRFSDYFTMERFLITFLYPQGEDVSGGRKIWLFDRIVGNWHHWDLKP